MVSLDVECCLSSDSEGNFGAFLHPDGIEKVPTSWQSRLLDVWKRSLQKERSLSVVPGAMVDVVVLTEKGAVVAEKQRRAEELDMKCSHAGEEKNREVGEVEAGEAKDLEGNCREMAMMEDEDVGVDGDRHTKAEMVVGGSVAAEESTKADENGSSEKKVLVEDGGASVQGPMDRAREKVKRGDCPLRDEFSRSLALSAEEVEDTLVKSGVERVEGWANDREDFKRWKEQESERESNFLSFEFRKQLRKRTLKFERFDRYQKEGSIDVEYRKSVDVRGKVILAPLTTVGNLPFRRLCKRLGADVTVGEMAVAEHVLKGMNDEWALLRRHKCEDIFGVQLAGSLSDVVAKASELISEHCDVDFIDLNVGCPIDMVCRKGAGSELLRRPDRLRGVIRKGSAVSTVPFSVKLRTGITNDPAGWNAHKVIPNMREWGASWITLHGRSKEQRYRRTADWSYIERCAKIARTAGMPLVGNGDVFSYEDAEEAAKVCDAVMVARGALIKPWIFTEIKESRYIDMTAAQRLELYREFVGYGLDHYGADARGIETTRKYLLEWMCFTCRYPPIGIFERAGERMDELRPRMNHRIPNTVGRDPLEMTLASRDPKNWVRISELLLGPTPTDYKFMPKHVSNAWVDEQSIAPQ